MKRMIDAAISFIWVSFTLVIIFTISPAVAQDTPPGGSAVDGTISIHGLTPVKIENTLTPFDGDFDTDEPIQLAFSGNAATAANPGKPTKDKKPLGEPSKVTKTYEPITTALPIWGQQVRDMGYELPLPFGLGVNVAYMDQGLELSEVRLGVNGTGTEPSGVTFEDSRDKTIAGIVRADFWLLPFANVYAMGGVVEGEADLTINVPAVTINDPILGAIPISSPFQINQKLDYDGTQVGLGLTLAAGYKQFFAVLDSNYSWADISIIEDTVGALSVSPKVGTIIETEMLPGTGGVYIGAMYLDFNLTIQGSVPGDTIDPALAGETLNYKVDASPKEPWNFVFGGTWEFNPRWSFVAEAGVGDRKQLILGGMFRF